MINVNRFILKSYELQSQQLHQKQQLNQSQQHYAPNDFAYPQLLLLQQQQHQQHQQQQQQQLPSKQLLLEAQPQMLGFESSPEKNTTNTDSDALRINYLTNRTSTLNTEQSENALTCLELGTKFEYDPLQEQLSPLQLNSQYVHLRQVSPTAQSMQFTFRNQQQESALVGSPKQNKTQLQQQQPRQQQLELSKQYNHPTQQQILLSGLSPEHHHHRLLSPSDLQTSNGSMSSVIVGSNFKVKSTNACQINLSDETHTNEQMTTASISRLKSTEQLTTTQSQSNGSSTQLSSQKKRPTEMGRSLSNSHLPFTSSRKKALVTKYINQASQIMNKSSIDSNVQSMTEKSSRTPSSHVSKTITQTQREVGPQRQRHSSRSPSINSLSNISNLQTNGSSYRFNVPYNALVYQLASPRQSCTSNSIDDKRNLGSSSTMLLNDVSNKNNLTSQPNTGNNQANFFQQNLKGLQEIVSPKKEIKQNQENLVEEQFLLSSERSRTLSRVCQSVLETKFNEFSSQFMQKQQHESSQKQVFEEERLTGKFYKSQSTLNIGNINKNDSEAGSVCGAKSRRKTPRKITAEMMSGSNSGKENHSNGVLIASSTERSIGVGKHHVSKQPTKPFSRADTTLGTSLISSTVGGHGINTSSSMKKTTSTVATALSVKCVHSVSQMYCYICNKNHRKRI